MKKVLSIAAIAMVATTGTFAKMSHTMYAGLGLGHKKAHSQINWASQNNLGQSEKAMIANDKFAGSAFLGYRMGMSDKAFIGAELDLQNGYTSKGRTDASSRNGYETSAQKIKASWAWGGSLLLGYHLNKSAYVALRAGFESRQFKVTPNLGMSNFAAPLTTNGNAKNVRKFNHTSFVPGILLGMPLSDCWEISGDYRWTMGSKKSSGKNTVSDIRWTHTPKSNTFMVRASYKFLSK